MKQKSLLTKLLLLVAVMLAGAGTAWSQSWVKTDITALSDGDVVVVLETAKYNRALLNAEATSSGSVKASSEVTLSADGSEITSTVDANIQWVFGGSSTSFTLKSNDDASRQLWCRDNNDALRVKASSPGSAYVGTFTWDDTYKMMQSTSYTRYVGIWKNSDTDYQWRAYNSQTATNIKGCETSFYKYTTGTGKIATTTTINATGLTNTDLYQGTSAGQLTATVATSETTLTNATVQWSSSNPEYATIDKSGNVTLVAEGTTVITAFYAGDDTYNASSATYQLTVVNNDPSNLKATFDFSTNKYNWESTSDNNTYFDGSGYNATEGDITIGFSGKVRLWESSGSYTMRFYNDETYGRGKMTLTAADGFVITGVSITGSTLSFQNPSSGTINGGEWTGSAQVLTIEKGSSTSNFTKVEVSYIQETGLPTPTVTIDATGITNTNVFVGTDAGSLAATVTYNDAPIEGATVTWSGNNDEVATIDATTGAVTLVTAGSVTFTATFAGNNDYSEKSATYEMTVTNSDPNAPGTENNPYTVAQAVAYINTLETSTSPTDVYVSGIISQVDSYNSTYNSITYWISDDGKTTGQMEVYSGKGLNGADFSAVTDLAVGDIVTVKGKVKKFNSTPEFDMNSQLVSFERPTTPTITVNPATVNATAAGASGTLSVAYNNVYPNVGVDAEWYTDASCATTTTAPTWIEIGYDTSNNVNYTIAENTGEARTAYMKIWSYSAPETIVYSELITFAQAAPVIPTYATLPFSFDGGKADIDNTDGLYQDGLDSDYSSSPKLKFNGTGDYVLLQFSERPGTLTFDVKGNTFSGGTFTVQTSEDGVTYTDLKNYTELVATQSETFNNLGENVRYIKWVYTEKSSGNVALGNIALAKYTATVIVPSITVDPETVNALATDTEGTLAITCENLTISDMSDFGVMFFDENNQELTGSSIPGWIQVLVAEQDPNIGDGYVVSYTMNENTTDEARTAYFEILAPVDAGDYVYSNRVTITQAASVAPEETVGIFVKVTSTDEITSGQYLIVYESGSVAFDGSLTTLDASNNTIDVTIENGMIAATTTNTQSVFNIDVTAGTLQSASGLYIGVSSNSNGLKTSVDATKYTNTFRIDEGENVVIAAVFEESTMTLRYNKGSNQNRFRYYSGSQQPIQLYKFVADADDVPVTISAAGYATYCSEKDLDFSGTGLTAYKAIATNSEVSFKEVKQVPAGQGVLLKGAQGEYSVPVAANAAALTGNKFVGVTEETTIDTDPADGIYVLMNKEQGVGFYKTTGTTFTLGAHTAYIPSMGSEARSFIGFDNTTTAINGVAAESMANGEVYNLQGQRVTKAQKGLYIMNGKKVVMK